MKFRCPGCGCIVDSLPPTHKCQNCDEFSQDWLIYDWESFASIKRRRIKYDLLIIGVILINLLAGTVLGSTNIFQWLANLLIIPAIISLFCCRRQLKRKSQYEGHKGGTVYPWFIGIGDI